VGVRGFSLAKMPSNSPYFSLVVFVPFDELCGERQALANRNLEGGDAVVVVNEVSGGRRLHRSQNLGLHELPWQFSRRSLA